MEKRVELTDVPRSETITEKTLLPPPDWEALVEQIADDMIRVHTPQQILVVRAKLYDLLSHCIPATVVLKVRKRANVLPNASEPSPCPEHRGREGSTKPDYQDDGPLTSPSSQTLTFKLVPRVDDDIKADVIQAAAMYDHRLRLGSKAIFHLEAFVAKFMRIVEGFENDLDL